MYLLLNYLLWPKYLPNPPFYARFNQWSQDYKPDSANKNVPISFHLVVGLASIRDHCLDPFGFHSELRSDDFKNSINPSFILTRILIYQLEFQ